MDTKNQKTYRFAKITMISYSDRIVEVIADEGVQLETEDLEELVKTIHAIQPEVTGYLANRKFRYSFSFSALQYVMKTKVADAVAILVHSSLAEQASRFIPGKNLKFKMKTFRDRDKAMLWLQEIAREKTEVSSSSDPTQISKTPRQNQG